MLPFDLIQPSVDGVPLRPSIPRQLDIEEAPAPFESPYVLSDYLATAVNAALAVDQPLLVTGEPGCGKTTLAWAVASQLGTSVEEFHTKSTSVARDLLYTMDTLRRFHDASVKLEEARDAGRYVTEQALGRALRSPRTTVVLIDEIDKAPRDFPNDLLRELDQKEFTIQETGEVVRQRARHFILVTSNGERRLPDAFLRRCVYADIPFPDDEMLVRIALAHCRALGVGRAFLETAVRRFEEVRGLDLGKRPATSELLAWVHVLHHRGVSEEALRDAPRSKLPGVELLLKLRDDLKAVQRA